MAHEICELKVQKKFTPMTQRTYTARMNKLKKDPRYDKEMDRTSDVYIEKLCELAMSYETMPSVAAEVRVDLSDYIPEGFGTCDCIMIGAGLLAITDYKHGRGVAVSALNNPQMRLYALGALKRYRAVYGDTIKRVCMTIVQPRVSNEVSRETISTREIEEWGESIKPIAQKAYTGAGAEFCPGDHCRFCRGKAQCKARAEMYSALGEFRDCVPEGRSFKGEPDGRILTRDEVGELLTRGKGLAAWYKDLEEYALSELLAGGEIPGWKAVEGRSVRAFSDQDAALAAVIAAGYDEALVYDRKPKTLTELEKLMGKTEFAEKIGGYVIKPPGKPTLADMSDKRAPYSSAAADFAGAV